MLFGVPEMKEFAESSNDERIKAMWRKIEESRSNAAKWCAAYEEIRSVLAEVASSPVDLENDGECCMRVKTTVMAEARKLSK